MPGTMRALVWTAPYESSLETLSRPKAEHGQVELEVLAAGVCGSDLHGYRGHSPVRVPPLVLGHELAGRYEGATYVVNPLIGCGECRLCQSGRPNLCPRRGLLGLDRPGAFAEYVSVPRANLTPLPDGMEPWQGTLAESLATPINALSTVELTRNSVVAVIGAGPIGLLAGYAAKRAGAGFVSTHDVDAARSGVARRHSDVVGTSAASVRGALLDASDGLGADLVVDAVGIAATRADALALVGPGGEIAHVGLGAENGDVPLADVVRKGVTIRGVYAYTPEHFAAALRLLEENPPPLDWVSEVAFDDGPGVLAALANGDGPLKAIFTFG